MKKFIQVCLLFLICLFVQVQGKTARNMIQALADTMYVWETDDQNLSNSANKMAQIEEKTEETNAKEFLINENQNLQLRALNPEQTYQMIVYSLDGKIILDQKLSNQTEANFSLSSGFYIARLYTANNNILTQKILIP